MIWIADQNFLGWACSQCEWNYPVPSLLADPEAKSAYDRLAKGKFAEHACENHLARMRMTGPESFAERVKKLVARGFKPRDAVEVLLQEISLEHRNEPKVIAQAKADADDFLRRLREGLI